MAAESQRPPRVIGDQTNMEASAVAIGARRSETPAVTWPPAIVAEPKRATFEVAADIADLANVLEAACGGANSHPENIDRKSVVEGKSLSVRVDPGGCRCIKKKKKNKKQNE